MKEGALIERTATADEHLTLDELGILHGTDKSSLGHGYLQHYERLWGHLRNERINIVEIGVGQGESLKLWSDYFPRAVVVGIDPRADARSQASKRCIVETGAWGDAEFLRKVASLYRPTIVIDNGSHQADDIVLAFQCLYPLVRDDGFYAIECLHFHAGAGASNWRGNATLLPQNYFSALARLAACPEGDEPVDRSLASQTAWVEFYYGSVVLRRKPGVAAKGSIARYRQLVERANHPRMWTNFSQFLINNGGDLQEAVMACRSAIVLNGSEASLYHSLSLALERVGDLTGAIDASCESVVLNPRIEMFRTRLAGLEQRRLESSTTIAAKDR